TYHLMLRPGADIVREAGGLHRFMAWDGPILTDSGGFQVFSLARLRNITDEGVLFRSHIDGAERFLSPQDAIHIQEALGADIIVALDHCPSYGDAPASVHEATERTHRWAAICQQVHQRRDQALFGIVQGGFDAGGRRRSAEAIAALDFPGYAIGGLSVGESKALELELLEAAVERLPSDRPRYVMGVGSPEDLVEHVARGIDMFDCVLPTRIARNGALFTPEGRANLRNARFRRQFGPVDETCDCYACRTFSAAYLHHLFRCEELLAYRLATIHNLRFLLRHMACMRNAIRNGTFAVFRRDFLSRYKPVDEDVAREQQRKWRLFNRSKPEPKVESGDLAAPEEEPA
ncbi:MAG: tRNA guanosine(34) transglycosylase Tgt, partial [Chloroflexi bacterium]|nr:tRNA guanosine(34) transglycosylase Tgt [Chloroflexota bacterium]